MRASEGIGVMGEGWPSAVVVLAAVVLTVVVVLGVVGREDKDTPHCILKPCCRL